ncbi:MAG: aminopeptidase, partial [Sphingomonas bacterium]|nr:aminopeptidase [Sphingomonas bacterium]
MLDIQTAAAQAPHAIRREDYRPPDWLVPEVALDFDLDPQATRVSARLEVRRNGDHARPLRLDGDGLSPVAVRVDGADAAWRMDGPALVIELSGDAHRIETEVVIAPQANSQLMGLYASAGMLCTQCEPEGFRRITFFPDRPDVLSRFTARMSADKARYPVLLANGDRTGGGDLPGGRHWAEWADPFPKPTYLFALVAADLVA